MEQMKKMPLEGIRVVELATVVAAPTASRVLCAFGAEVIKVETKIGDEMRRAGEFEMVVCEDDKNPLFTIQNSGKRLTSIDLKNPDGKAAFLKLLETADVFLTNVRLPSLGSGCLCGTPSGSRLRDAAQGLPRPRVRALFRLRPEGARRRQARL